MKHIPPMNTVPDRADPVAQLPSGFLDFYKPLHAAFAARRNALVSKRAKVLAASHAGNKPDHLPPSAATQGDWHIELPDWCRDQRNQMTGPADDAALVVKMLNSGAPGVMLDLEDSAANSWSSLLLGHANIIAALEGSLTYNDAKRGRAVGIQASDTVILSRVRGLHLGQAGLLDDITPASLFDTALIAYQVDTTKLRHPLALYIPKSESAEEALWWADVFAAIAESRGWSRDYIKCMALVESHPMAFAMEEFLFNLKDHILGLNLGRWDYMASLIDFNLTDPDWVLPDRNTIPSEVDFFQRLRFLQVDICHSRGVMAIGGMTALYPSRVDSELNTRALAVLERDKKNEAECLMDGAWTGHPDQNEIAVAQFPYPNQIDKKHGAERYPNLRAIPRGIGVHTTEGTIAAVRTVIRYRNGVLNGRGASLLDGYMEDLATDRIYRLMITQRIMHSADPGANNFVPVTDQSGIVIPHTPAYIDKLFDAELERLLTENAQGLEAGSAATLSEARLQSRQMIKHGFHSPI